MFFIFIENYSLKMSNLQKKPYKARGNGKRSPYKTEDILQELITLKIKEHYTNMSLLQHIQEKYNFSKTWAYNLLNEAANEIKLIQEKNVENLLAEQQGKLLNDIEQMKKDGEHKRTILEYLKEYNKISGLYQERIQITGDIKIQADFGFEKNKDDDEQDTSRIIQTTSDPEENY